MLFRSSVLKDVLSARVSFFGPAPDTISNQMLLAALGGRPDKVLLCPVLVRQIAVGALYADGLGSDADLPFAEAVASALATAMERIILEQKGAKK